MGAVQMKEQELEVIGAYVKNHIADDLAAALGRDNFYLNLYLEEISDNISISGNITVKEGLLSVNNILDDVQDKEKSFRPIYRRI